MIMGFHDHLGDHQGGRVLPGWGAGSQEFSSQGPGPTVPHLSAPLLMYRAPRPDMGPRAVSSSLEQAYSNPEGTPHAAAGEVGFIFPPLHLDLQFPLGSSAGFEHIPFPYNDQWNLFDGAMMLQCKLPRRKMASFLVTVFI